MRLCTIEGCDREHVAKGLCRTHYNRTNPNRHPKVQVDCSACGEAMMRDPSVKRWATTYCSEVCRVWGVWKTGWSSRLPADHWARMYGATCDWSPKPMPRAIECEWCGAVAHSLNDRARFCSRACNKKAGRRRRRAAEFNAAGMYKWSEVTRLWLAFNRCCAYCRTPTPLDELQAEHVHPLSRGGRNDLSNLLPSCGGCNADKRDLLLSEWNADRARRHLAPVVTSWSDADRRYWHLNTRSNVQAVGA